LEILCLKAPRLNSDLHVGVQRERRSRMLSPRPQTEICPPWGQDVTCPAIECVQSPDGDRIARRAPAFRPGSERAVATRKTSQYLRYNTCCLKSWFAVVGDSSPRKTMSELALVFQILVKGLAGLGVVRASGIKDFSQMCERVWPCLSPRLPASKRIARKSYQ